MSVWVMPSVIDVYENFLKRSQAVAGGRRRSQAVGTPSGLLAFSIALCGHIGHDNSMGMQQVPSKFL